MTRSTPYTTSKHTPETPPTLETPFTPESLPTPDQNKDWVYGHSDPTQSTPSTPPSPQDVARHTHLRLDPNNVQPYNLPKITTEYNLHNSCTNISNIKEEPPPATNPFLELREKDRNDTNT